MKYGVVMGMLVATALVWADGKLKVPDVRGKTVAEANAIVKQAGFVYEVTPFDVGCDASAPKHGNGTIRCQSPDPGSLADKHAMVRVAIQQDFDDSASPSMRRSRNCAISATRATSTSKPTMAATRARRASCARSSRTGTSTRSP
jgi:hypothetical protein